MISSGRRVAYNRISGRDLIYSIVDEECGKYCGKVQTMFLKVSQFSSLDTLKKELERRFISSKVRHVTISIVESRIICLKKI